MSVFDDKAKVRIRCGEQTIDGWTILRASNGRPAMVGFEGLLRVGGGFYVGQMPVIAEDNGKYSDLIRRCEIEIEEIPEPTP